MTGPSATSHRRALRVVLGRSHRRALRVVLIGLMHLALSQALGCDRAVMVSGHGDVGCRFEVEHTVATAAAFGFDDLAVLGEGETRIALWSEPAGLFGRRLQRDGRPLEPAEALGPRCRGGLAAVTVGRVIHIACLQVPHRLPMAVRPGGVGTDVGKGPTGDASVDALAEPSRLLWLTRRDAPGLPARHPAATVAEVGVGSTGVALAGAEGALWAAWRDVHGLAEAVRLVKLDPRGASPASPLSSTTLSPAGAAVGPPALRLSAAGPQVVWAQREVVGQALDRGLWLSDAGERPVRLAAATARAPRPAWVPGLPGRSVLGYRGGRRGLYLAELGPAELDPAARLGPRSRVARADGSASPAFAACPMGLVAATPRRYAGDDFVGVNVLAADFSRRTPERQFYEDAHGFGAAAVTCSAPGALLLIGERARFERPKVALRAVVLRCD